TATIPSYAPLLAAFSIAHSLPGNRQSRAIRPEQQMNVKAFLMSRRFARTEQIHWRLSRLPCFDRRALGRPPRRLLQALYLKTAGSNLGTHSRANLIEQIRI